MNSPNHQDLIIRTSKTRCDDEDLKPRGDDKLRGDDEDLRPQAMSGDVKEATTAEGHHHNR